MEIGQADSIRRRLDLRGQVQGVGFRPFVYRLAGEHGLGGWVANNSNGAVIEVEGPADKIAAFEEDLVRRLPPLAHIAELRRADVQPLGESEFRIRGSQADPHRRPEVTPDAATCRDCLRELLDPQDRRHRYPFINCTNCGPRYSIIRTVPYDRPATTMAVFQMCPPCECEYTDPADRRFHAQPNACAECGPQLRLCRVAAGAQPGEWATMAINGDPVREAAGLLAAGKIVAIKGIGGYHLACRADCEEAVQRLRERKLRDGKPLAVMVPSEAEARRVCRLSEADVRALRSPAAPIVLAPRAEAHGLAASIAPGTNTFGIMLPYAPVHHLLFAEGLPPLVMTSANLAAQPLTYRDEDAFAELHEVADAFLLHNREIFRPIDDSVVFTFRADTVPIRRARGYAPRPLRIAACGDGGPLAGVRGKRILAVGGELKSTVCLLTGGEAIISEHLGDLTNPAAYRHFARAIERLEELYGFAPELVVHDMHPQYLSTHYARQRGLPTIAVQHHHAHVASVMAEWGENGPVVGLSCDGTGYGPDSAVWGGEVLYCQRGEFERVGHLEYFPLVGGNAAAIETWRPAAALLRLAFGDEWQAVMPTDGAGDLAVFAQQVAAGVNSPPGSSLGRVFDAVSYLLGLCSRNRHEAEAAMALEAAAGTESVEPYPYEIVERERQPLARAETVGRHAERSEASCHGRTEIPRCARNDAVQHSLVRVVTLSLVPMIRAIVSAVQSGEPVARIAARFHETVAHLLADAGERICRGRGVGTVALSGGCFANRRLLGRLVELLESRGRRVLYHRSVPTGDGGVSLGQALVGAWKLTEAE